MAILKSDDFYSNEKLVYLHVGLFVAFTIVVSVEYILEFVTDLVLYDSDTKT